MGLLEGLIDFSFLSPLFYFLLGVCMTVYCLLLIRSDKKAKLEKADTSSVVKFYLNIFVLNKEEALATAVKTKMKDRPRLIRGLAKALINNVVSEEKFVGSIGEKMTGIIPEKLVEMGVKSDVEVAYHHGNYLCLEINIVSADARKVIEKKGGKSKLVQYDDFLDMFGIPQLNQSIDDTVAAVIGDKLQQNLPLILKEKMKDKIGLELRINGSSESEQAAFFLGTLKELKDVEK